MSATLLPIPSGTWTLDGESVEVLAMWLDVSGRPSALVRMADNCVGFLAVGNMRLSRPNPATTLEGVLAELDTLRESTAWAPAGDPVARVHRELARIIEAARAGA